MSSRNNRKPGPSVLLPNIESIQPTNQGQLPISTNLQYNAQTLMILPQLKIVSLISIGQLCDDDCYLLLNKKKLYDSKESELTLEGNRNNSNGL